MIHLSHFFTSYFTYTLVSSHPYLVVSLSCFVHPLIDPHLTPLHSTLNLSFCFAYGLRSSCSGFACSSKRTTSSTHYASRDGVRISRPEIYEQSFVYCNRATATCLPPKVLQLGLPEIDKLFLFFRRSSLPFPSVLIPSPYVFTFVYGPLPLHYFFHFSFSIHSAAFLFFTNHSCRHSSSGLVFFRMPNIFSA